MYINTTRIISSRNNRIKKKMEQERKIELLKNYLDIDISTNINDFDNVDCMIYSESTADGYEVWICTNNNRHPSINEDVYYYNHDLPDRFEDQTRWGDKTFYIGEDIYDDCYFDDHLEEMFMQRVEDIIEELKTDITEEEIEYLKEEYGIEDEETETA